MKKIWLDSYPSEVQVDVNLDTYSSLVDLFDQTCQKFATKPAFYNMGKTLSFTELEQESRAFAAYFQNTLGLKAGERIALMMPNCLQYPVILFAALRSGLVVVNVNPLYTARELEHQLSDSEANSIVIMANFAHVLNKIIDKTSIRHVIVTELGDLLGLKGHLVNFVVKHVKKMVPAYHLPTAIAFKKALAQGRQLDYTPVSVKQTDLAFLQYTGGTTGVAKGAMLTHRNMLANMEQVSMWMGSRLEQGEEIVISALPLYHIFCLTANCLFFMKLGGLNVLITNPRDMPAFVKELRNFRFSAITGVNTLFNALANRDDFKQLDFSGLKLTVGGGAAIQEHVAEQWKKVTDCHVLEGYGLTESSPLVTLNLPDDTHFTNSIGIPVPSTDVSLCNDEGEEVATGEAGELWVRGPQVMLGYWRRPEATAETITQEGWLKTGDIATIDVKGFLRIVDRKKDMVIVSGFNVYPNEIENVIAHHEAVLEIACIGVPDEKTGEAVKAFIVLRDGFSLDKEALRAYCKKELAAYKVPKQVEFRTELPKSNVGKILRRELR